jgi:hypothetical protein
MKSKEKVQELLEALKLETESSYEMTVIKEFERKINAEPRVKIIDENCQEFEGHLYKRATNKGKPNYFARVEWLHRKVMESYIGEIPKGYDVHHSTKNENGYFDTNKNNIEDLELMTESDHLALHQQYRKKELFVCKNCGKKYESPTTGRNCFCSQKCNNEWRRKNLLVEVVCPICGTIFTTPKRQRQTQCCSKKCAYQFRILNYGKEHFNVKLSEEDVKFIRENYKALDKDFGQIALAKRFNVNRKTIESIVHNKTHIK